MKPQSRVLHGNLAVANIAYKTNEVCAIYPITPSSDMSELVEEWSANDQPNIFGTVPTTIQMQSEAGVAGLMHGALQTGSLSTSFTSSQGLLLMLPNMYRIAGELTPNVIHVATRSIATHALSVFGDHSDVMAVRSSGYAMLASANVQEAMDFALIAQTATLKSRIPFLHFFDGFRTSHETATIDPVSDEVIGEMMAESTADIEAHRKRALNPNKPFIRGTAQREDTFFQSREAINSFYQQCPGIVQEKMDAFAKLTGRFYNLFDYIGHPEATHVITTMASSSDTVEKTVNYLSSRGERVGLIKVRLFRPFSAVHLFNALPQSCRALAVLDRTKEPGAAGEPLHQDVALALREHPRGGEIKLVGGRYGLSSKEFTPAMVKAVFDNLDEPKPINHFTVGIEDDLTGLSLTVDPSFMIDNNCYEVLICEPKSAAASVGAERLATTLGASAENYVQSYTEIDYRKANARVLTNLRISPEPINMPYLISQADLLMIDRLDYITPRLLSRLKPTATILTGNGQSISVIEYTAKAMKGSSHKLCA